MQSTVKRMANSLGRLDAAVEAMHAETVACRRTLMVFRARMDAAERVVARMSAALEQTLGVLTEAETEARRAADIFRAAAEGRSAA